MSSNAVTALDVLMKIVEKTDDSEVLKNVSDNIKEIELCAINANQEINDSNNGAWLENKKNHLQANIYHHGINAQTLLSQQQYKISPAQEFSDVEYT